MLFKKLTIEEFEKGLDKLQQKGVFVINYKTKTIYLSDSFEQSFNEAYEYLKDEVTFQAVNLNMKLMQIVGGAYASCGLSQEGEDVATFFNNVITISSIIDYLIERQENVDLEEWMQYTKIRKL